VKLSKLCHFIVCTLHWISGSARSHKIYTTSSPAFTSFAPISECIKWFEKQTGRFRKCIVINDWLGV